MEKLTLTLPGNSPLPIPTPQNLSPTFSNVGNFLTEAYSLIFYISLVVCFIWLVWGAYQYIFAGGDQEALASAKSRITWALFGLVFVLLAYVITQFAAQMINPGQLNPTGPTPFPKGLPFST